MLLRYLSLTVVITTLHLHQAHAVSTKYLQDQLVAKAYGVATRKSLFFSNGTPSLFPEWIGENETQYNYHDVTDWTSGFFGGTLYLLYEMSIHTALPLSSPELYSLAKTWSDPLATQRSRNDTHDLGFMIFSSIGWEARLTNNATAKKIIYDAANSVARRYNPIVKCIRSWGDISDTTDFQVIIDNLMNLEMLFWAAQEFQNSTLHDIALSHATTTMTNHFRPTNFSTWHVVSYSQTTGLPTRKYTNQGYADWSTWTRGQAWAVYGMAIAYNWTSHAPFLETAHKAADLFLSELRNENAEDGIPYWDFDAPEPGPRDTSAAMALASGLLYMVQNDRTGSSRKYLEPAVDLVRDTLRLSLAPPAVFTERPFRVVSTGWDSILMNGTIDNNPNTTLNTITLRSANTGIVYAGYYLVYALNQLREMGLLGDVV